MSNSTHIPKPQLPQVVYYRGNWGEYQAALAVDPTIRLVAWPWRTEDKTFTWVK